MSVPKSINQALFESEIPVDFQRAIVRFVCSTCRTSRESLFASRAYPEAHFLWPYQRRADVEGGLRELAISHGLKAVPEPFDKNGEFYTKIETDHVYCTISYTAERNLPRGAKARETMALDSQYSLFEQPAPPPDAKLYAIIAYGGFSDSSHLPEFIDVIFPSRDYTYIVDRIRLLDLFMDELGGNTTAPENIPDTGGPKIRPKTNNEA